MFSLIEMLGRACPRIDIVDVGAMWLGGEVVSYRALLKGESHVVGFEPVQAECDKLNAMKMRNQRYLPYFVGDGAERTFYLSNMPMTSSLYEPNTPLLKQFTDLEELMQTVETSRVQTKRLDDISELDGMDFLKVDVQGAELDVLRGAPRRLKDCAAVQVEVEFSPLYKGQPLFGDVDAFMRSQGFVLFALGPSMFGRAFRPFVPIANTRGMAHQLLWTDAVYFKDFMRFAELPADVLLKIAVISHDLYRSYDFAARAIQYYDAKAGKGLWKIYMARLYGNSIPAAPPLYPVGHGS